jgi:hypothetical protein
VTDWQPAAACVSAQKNVPIFGKNDYKNKWIYFARCGIM